MTKGRLPSIGGDTVGGNRRLSFSSPLREPLVVKRSLSKRRAPLKKINTIEEYISAHPIPASEVLYPSNIFVNPSTDDSTKCSSVDVENGVIGQSREQLPFQPGKTQEYLGTPSTSDRIQKILDSLPAQRAAGFVTIAMFAGYAALFSLQHVIKVFFGIPDDESNASHCFSFAITSLYLWNLLFRLGHNVLLKFCGPKMRSLVGIFAMTLSMLILAVGVFVWNHKSLWVLATAYAFGGIGVGTFETNFSVVLASLGNRTKIYGISGIPVGIFLVIVPGFILVAMGLNVVYIYTLIVVMLLVAGAILLFGLTYPEVEFLLSGNDLDESFLFPSGASSPVLHYQPHTPSSKQRRHWTSQVLSVGVVFTVNMFFVSAFSPGVLLYLYNKPQVLLGSDTLAQWLGVANPFNNLSISTGYFFALFSSFGFVADVLSRRRIYANKPAHHPIRYLVFTLIGVAVIVCQIPIIAPLGTFFVFLANGSIYAQSCRYLDMRLNPDVSVLGNSVFFFLGDCGSVMGAVMIPFIRDVMASNGWY